MTVAVIRSARLSDVPEIAAIHVEAWPGEGGPTFEQRLELWHHLLGGGSRRVQVWVALDDSGQVTGFVGAGSARVLRDRFEGEISALYIAPDSRRQGIGSALLRQAFEWFRRRKIASVMAWVPEGGEARAFFASRGAVSLDQRRTVSTGAGTQAEAAVGWLSLP